MFLALYVSLSVIGSMPTLECATRVPAIVKSSAMDCAVDSMTSTGLMILKRA